MIARGDFVTLTVAGRDPVRAMVVIASPTGASLAVMYDAVLDGCGAGMALLFDGQGYRNILTQRRIGVFDEGGAPVIPVDPLRNGGAS